MAGNSRIHGIRAKRVCSGFRSVCMYVRMYDTYVCLHTYRQAEKGSEREREKERLRDCPGERKRLRESERGGGSDYNQCAFTRGVAECLLWLSFLCRKRGFGCVNVHLYFSINTNILL